MRDTPPSAAPQCTCSCHNGGRFATCSLPGGCAHLHPGNHVDTPIGGELDYSRPSSACLTCPPPGPSRKAWTPAHKGYRTCDDCYTALRERLLDVRGRYARLDATPGANLEHGSRGAPGFASKPTASLHVVTMRDWRSLSCETARDAIAYCWDPLADTVLEPGQYGPPGGAFTQKREVWYGGDGRGHSEQENPPRSVPKVLAGWTDVVAGERDMKPPDTRVVPELVRWLDSQMDWLTRQEWIGDVDEDLRRLVAQLRPVTGDPAPTRFGKCPNVVSEETQTLCGAPLWTPEPGSDTITCTSCKRPWKRPDWEHLGRLIQQRRIETLRAS